MQGLRFLTANDIESLMVNLKNEIAILEKRVTENSTFANNFGDRDKFSSLEKQNLELNRQMLRQAEDELLERAIAGEEIKADDNTDIKVHEDTDYESG